MAVKGFDLFSERFAEFRDVFILIGGTACDLWFADQNLAFRATKADSRAQTAGRGSRPSTALNSS